MSSTYSHEQVVFIQQILTKFEKAEDGQAVAVCGRVESLVSGLGPRLILVEGLLCGERKQQQYFQVTADRWQKE
jgi:hypothetical protein